MKKTKYHLLALFIISIFTFSLIMSCIPELADVNPPVVNIVYPSNGTNVNGIVPIVVSASDEDKVKEMQIFIDGITVVITDKNFVSYSWDTNPYADNLDHYISAIALDESDNIGNTPVIAVTVIRGDNHDNTDPVVQILNPVGGQIVTGDVNIVAEASDDNEVERVEFYIDGLLEKTVLIRPFDYLWKTTLADTGDHTIFARAYDTNANTAASATITVIVDTTLDNTPPVVNIINPINGQTVSGNVNIVADATDNNQVNRVEFYIDGLLETTVSTPPFDYLWNTNQFSGGLHTIFVKAYDPNNNSGVSPTITVTIEDDNTPPVVNIINPINGQVVNGMVNIVAEATDNIQVDHVEFYIDGLLEHTVSSPPFDYLWNTTLVDTGVHTIFARAYDPSNNSAASPTITVIVRETSLMGYINPKVKIVNPNRNGIIFSKSETKLISITVEAPKYSQVQKVEFYIDGNLQKVVTNAIDNRFKYDWNFDGSADGLLHTIFVKAYNNSLNTNADMIVVRVYP